MALPKIQSAIPKRRYQYGEFIVTILSDITSPDPYDYLYIAAVLRDGCTQPEVYITCESIQKIGQQSYSIKVLSQDSEHTISQNSQWKNEQLFFDYVLQGVGQMFHLTDETPILLT